MVRFRLRTIAAIVKRWAPASDGNDPQAYAQAVARYTGFDVDAQLAPDVDTLAALAAAIIHHENGEQPYRLYVIRQAAKETL